MNRSRCPPATEPLRPTEIERSQSQPDDSARHLDDCDLSESRRSHDARRGKLNHRGPSIRQ